MTTLSRRKHCNNGSHAVRAYAVCAGGMVWCKWAQGVRRAPQGDMRTPGRGQEAVLGAEWCEVPATRSQLTGTLCMPTQQLRIRVEHRVAWHDHDRLLRWTVAVQEFAST
jgi:hypothetical protein